MSAEENASGESSSERDEHVVSGQASANESGTDAVEGERGKPAVNRFRSVQSRVSSLLTFSLMGALVIGLLIWYYVHVFSNRAIHAQAVEKSIQRRTQSDSPLPSLGRIDPPTTAPDLDSLLGPKPELPKTTEAKTPARRGGPRRIGRKELTPAELALNRKLQGAVFARAESSRGTGSRASASQGAADRRNDTSDAATTTASTADTDAEESLAAHLIPTITSAVRAQVLPTRQLLLSKGAFIDCTLETAIDSTLPGMTSCVTATDTYSTDGSVVLLERGTKLIGETQGQVKEGMRRLFVLWSEARTPTGVVIPLASPATDDLGRSGVDGEIHRHFWSRFGAAILISVIDGALQSATRPKSGEGGIVITPSGSRDVLTEILRSTVRVPPTLTKHQGERVQVFVARDVDFRSVYQLSLTAEARRDTSDAGNGEVGP